MTGWMTTYIHMIHDFQWPRYQNPQLTCRNDVNDQSTWREPTIIWPEKYLKNPLNDHTSTTNDQDWMTWHGKVRDVDRGQPLDHRSAWTIPPTFDFLWLPNAPARVRWSTDHLPPLPVSGWRDNKTLCRGHQVKRYVVDQTQCDLTLTSVRPFGNHLYGSWHYKMTSVAGCCYLGLRSMTLNTCSSQLGLIVLEASTMTRTSS